MVTASIAEELPNIHGFDLKTKVPESVSKPLSKNDKKEESK